MCRGARILTYTCALVILAALTAAVSCHGGGSPHCILPDGCAADDGDIVLRRGTGLTSHAVAYADGGSDYSHCGIAVVRNGRVMVVHAVPDEPDFEGDVDRVKMEPIESFFSSLRASKGCILRCVDRRVAAGSARKALEIYRRGVLFDHDYDISDTTKMYCSELVELAYSTHGISPAEGRRHNMRFPGMKLKNVILPSDYLKSHHLHMVAHFQDGISF